MTLEMSLMMSLALSLARDVTRYDTCNATCDRKICHIYSSLTNPNDNTPCLKIDQIQQWSQKKGSKQEVSKAKPKRRENKEFSLLTELIMRIHNILTQLTQAPSALGILLW